MASSDFFRHAFEQALDEAPPCSLDVYLGPLVQKTHQMTASALTRSLPVIRRIAHEAPSLQVSGARLEKGVASLIQAKVGLLSPGQTSLGKANEVANHFMNLLKFMRQMHREETQCAEDARWL